MLPDPHTLVHAFLRRAQPPSRACRRAAIAGARALLLAAVFAGASASAEVVAKAGTVELSSSDIQALVASLPAPSRAAVAADLRALEQLIRSELLRRSVMGEIRAAGFDRTPAVAAQLDRLRDEALLRLWVAEKSMPPASFPAEAEIAAAYEANPQAFAAPAQYRIAQVFVSAPDGGDPARTAAALAKFADIARQLPAGDFAALARSQSEHAESAANGGDLGFLPGDRLLPEIAAAVRGLQPGQTVGPVKTAQGLHFLKLLEIKPGAVPPLADIKDAMAATMRDTRARQLEQAYLAELGQRLGITINQIELARIQPTLR